MLVVGVAGLVALVLGVVARRTAVTEAEVDVFRWLNDAPDALGRPVWVVMQLGSFWGAIAVAALVMGLLRGWRGAIVGMVTTLTAWLVAIMAKAWVERGRPADYLHGIHSRFVHLETGNGYPSGHTAVAFAVATLAAGSLSGRWRILPFLAAGLVGFGRIYFGAHLPLDVVGGAALGVAVGTVACILLGDTVQPVTVRSTTLAP
jgi:undecaprenyl-diphosphatase